jgi:hypothetical protein
MFLPVLLVRDSGVAGFWVFVIPNVLGAAAMGWVLRDARMSLELMRRHSVACTAFSLATIAYQFFFATWLSHWPVFGARVGPAALPLTVVMAAIVMIVLGAARLRLAAIIVLSISVAAFVVMLTTRAPIEVATASKARPSDVIWLALACALGFLLCPYLDATFHLARQRTSPGGGRVAFALGFGVFFFPMLLFSLAYARPVAAMLANGSTGGLSMLVWWGICIHIILQLAFTVAAHYERVKQLNIWLWLAAPIVGIAFAELAVVMPRWLARDNSEVVYLGFLSLYALVFPTYVWLFMVPVGKRRTEMSVRNLAVLALAVMLASPAYWLAFIEGKVVWVVAGLGVVLCAKLLMRTERTESELWQIQSSESAS